MKHATCMALVAVQEGHEQPVPFKGTQSALRLLLKSQVV